MSGAYRKAAGSLLFLGAAQFIVAMVIAEALYLNYSVSRNAISDLGVGDTAPIFNTSIVLLGVTVLFSAYFVFLAFRKVIPVFLFFLAGLGAVGVGLFPETFGFLHLIVSFLAFFFGGLSAIVAYQLQKRPLNYFSVIMGVLSLVALVLYGSKQYLGLGLGGMERMIAYPILLWAVGFGGYLIGQQHST